MKKREIVRNWILILAVMAIIGSLFGHFLSWQWGLGISLGLFFGLIILLRLALIGISGLSSLKMTGTSNGYLIQREK